MAYKLAETKEAPFANVNLIYLDQTRIITKELGCKSLGTCENYI